MASRRTHPTTEHSTRSTSSRLPGLEGLVEEELLEWYLMTPDERWVESRRLWATFELLGGSLEPQPDSQSPFDLSSDEGADRSGL